MGASKMGGAVVVHAGREEVFTGGAGQVSLLAGALLVFGWFELGLLGAWMLLPEEVEVVPLVIRLLEGRWLWKGRSAVLREGLGTWTFPLPHRQCMRRLALATASCSGAVRRYRDEEVAELMLSFGFPLRIPALVARRQAASWGLLKPSTRTRPHLDSTWVPAGTNRPLSLRDSSI